MTSGPDRVTGVADDGWGRLEDERRELAERAEQFGLGVHAERLNRGGGVPPRLTETPMIIDTDIGGDPDDAIALMTAARICPQLALVVTSDEVRGERARFARHLLNLAGRPDVPVVAGRQLAESPYFCVEGLTEPQVGPQPSDVAGAVARVVAASTGPVRWVGMGPLTNLAELATHAPDLTTRLQVTQMGGAINYRDPTRAEHNFRMDPQAARAVVGTVARLRLVTSDVTFNPQLQVDPRSPIYQAFAHPQAPMWAQLVRLHMDRWFARFHPGTIQHDALTLSAALQLPFVDFDLMPVLLAEDARMSAAEPGPHHFVSVRARYDAFNRWLYQSLTGAPVAA